MWKGIIAPVINLKWVEVPNQTVYLLERPLIYKDLRGPSRDIAFIITSKPSFTEDCTVSTPIDCPGRIAKATLLPPY
ncbi:hypothetical protein N7465_012014 [Penicillium sp. CMV-2018d]|nr:hypothetical protein N7465_012014 [Penicillium sp. CMV-2018d]